MQKNTLLILLLSVAFHFSNAQSSVAIGSNTPNPKAVLWLNAQGGQGLLLPSLNTTSRTSMGLNNTTEKGMMVYDNQLDQIFFWNGTVWVEAVGSGSVEVDGIVGNEVTKVTTDRGLSLTGSGTAVSPLSVGLIDGTADQQVLKWNNVTKKWELGTDAGSAFIAGAGIQITGTTLTNTGDTDATNDITTSSIAAGDVTGPFSNLQIGSTTVTSAELASNAVTTLKIADDAVTLAKIGTAGVTDALKVLTTDASGNPQWSSSGATGDMLKTVYDPSSTNASAFDINNHTGDIATTQIENSAVTPVKIAGAGASARGILGSDNNTVSWVTGTPSQLLGTDATGAFQFTDKSNFIFTTPNVIPKGSVTGLVSSQLFDDGTNVGIGNATPAYKLDVFGTALIRPVIIGSAAYLGTSWFSLQHQQLPLNNISYAFAQHKGGYTLINTPSSAGLNFIDFRVDDVSKMRMLENGNVGIGTTTPLYPLDIKTPLGVSTYGLNHTDGDIIMSTYVGNGGVIGGSIGTQSNHPFFIYTNNSGAKLTVLPTGDIGIGTTAPTEKLEVNGNIKTANSLILTDGTFAYTTSVVASSYDVRYSGNSSLKINGFNTTIGQGFVGGGTRLTVGNSGDGSVAIANSWNLFSDIRLKKNVSTYLDALATVDKLRGVKFEWIKSGIPDIGLIAQEVEKIIPEIVQTHEETGYKSVSYEKVVAVLIEAIKEQQSIIDKMKTEEKLSNFKQEAEMAQIRSELLQIKQALSLEARKGKNQ